MSTSRDNEFLRAIELTSGTEVGDIDRGIAAYLEDRARESRRKAQALYDERIARQRELDLAAGGMAEHERAVRTRERLAAAKAATEERVFDRVREKLSRYTETAEYKKHITGSVKKMLGMCGDHPIVIYIGEKDASLIPDITALSDTVTVKTASDIDIGGVRGVSEHARLYLDDTLGSALEAQRDHWREISGIDSI